MANIQVTHDSNPNNARSESSIAINPNNPLQIVSASKKFVDIETYNFTLATEYSTDGGQTWHDSGPLAMPGFTVMTDPTLAWDDIGNVYLVGLGGTLGTTPPVFHTTGIVMYKSADGGKTWGAPYPIPGTTGADKQWAAGDSNPASPYHGNVYAVWDKLDAPGAMAFARTLDHGASWTGAGGAAAGHWDYDHPGRAAAHGLGLSGVSGRHLPRAHGSNRLFVRTDGLRGVGRLSRGRLAHLLRTFERRRGDLDHGRVRTAAAYPADPVQCSALPSANRDRSERCRRVHVLRVRSEAVEIHDRCDHVPVVRSRQFVQLPRRDRPAVGSVC